MCGSVMGFSHFALSAVRQSTTTHRHAQRMRQISVLLQRSAATRHHYTNNMGTQPPPTPPTSIESAMLATTADAASALYSQRAARVAHTYTHTPTYAAHSCCTACSFRKAHCRCCCCCCCTRQRAYKHIYTRNRISRVLRELMFVSARCVKACERLRARCVVVWL